MTMNRELQNWCDRNAHELSTPERKPEMKNYAWIILNPLTALFAAFGTVALLFTLLGWSE